MNRWLPVGLACLLLLLGGCTHQYVMKLNNGMRLTAASKPKLKDGIYYYKDSKGGLNSVSQSRVREIEPASTAAGENKFTPAKPTRRHWYWPF